MSSAMAAQMQRGAALFSRAALTRSARKHFDDAMHQDRCSN